MKNKKLLALLAGLLVIVVVILICVFTIFIPMIKNGAISTNNIAINSIHNPCGDKVYATYDFLTGHRQYSFELAEGETRVVDVDITTKEGKLELTIEQDGKEADYSGKNLPTGHFTVNLKNPGKYTIEVNTRKHVGGYNISWEKNNHN